MVGVAVSGYETDTVTIRIGAEDYRVRMLRDRQQYADPDGSAERAGVSSATWPLFGMFWPAGLALAEAMLQFPVAGKRILEVGCGTALSSLVLQRRGADITASDHHPLAAQFLGHNAQLNGLPPIKYQDAQWQGPNPALGTFDVIIGGDVLYERDHPGLLAEFIRLHAKPSCTVLISEPGRGYRGQFSSKLLAQGYTRSEEPFTGAAAQGEPKGRVLRFDR